MQKSQSEGSLAFLKDSKAPCELIPMTRKNKCAESASLIFFADDENSASIQVAKSLCLGKDVQVTASLRKWHQQG